MLAVGLWLGGLAGLLLTLGRTPSQATSTAARRFARVATAGIVIVALTGLQRAIAEVGTLDALVSTDFGRLVIAKVGLLGVLAVLGAVNHFRNAPAAGRSLRGLRRAGSAELLVGATVVLISATLVNLAPPVEGARAASGAGGSGASLASPAPTPSTPTPTTAPLLADGNDFGTSVRLHLVVTPGVAGPNGFTATVTDFDTGAAVAASGVSLRFTPPRSDVGTSRLDLTGAAGTYRGTGSNLSLAGTWKIAATVANGSSSVEVPLTLTVPGGTAGAPAGATPGPSIDVNAVPGLPTIYTVHLSAGRSVQVYFDPGTPGDNELHVTFFDASGTELPVTAVRLDLTSPTGAPVILSSRLLEPGHFVADAALPSGTYHLRIAGPAPNGDELSAELDVPISR